MTPSSAWPNHATTSGYLRLYPCDTETKMQLRQQAQSHHSGCRNSETVSAHALPFSRSNPMKVSRFLLAGIFLILSLSVSQTASIAAMPDAQSDSGIAPPNPAGMVAPAGASNDRPVPSAPGVVLIGLKSGVSAGSYLAGARANDVSLEAAFIELGIQAIEPVFRNTQRAQLAPSNPAGGEVDLSRIYRLRLAANADLQRAVRELSAHPAVAYAEPDYLAHIIAMPNDPLFAGQWALTQINAPAAWDVVTGTNDIAVAVVDSGMNVAHPDLVAQLWVNPGELAGNGADDDNNGYIDDINGWNIYQNTADLTDSTGHGVEVAGVIAAATNNAAGMAGVCWNCRLMIVKVTQPGGVANYSDIAAGITYAAQKGAKVINLSLGGSADSTTLRAAITAAAQTAVVVGGAGNNNSNAPFYPAAYDEVLAVAGTTSADTKVGTSNYGTWVDVSAPGENILTTFSGGGYGSTSGTSMAAPFASGMAGLLRSQHPGWSANMVRAQIVHTTDSIDSANPAYTGQLGSGRINAANAMQAPHPLLSISGLTVNGAPGGRPDPNSSNNSLIVQVANGWLDATNVVGTLSESDPFVTIENGVSSFSNIASGATQSGTAFSFSVANGAGYNHIIPFTLNLSANDGAYTVAMSLTVTTRSGLQPVGGLITADTVWTSDRTYIVNSDITVVPSVTLTIQPATMIRFNGFYRIDVRGQLVAIGTAANPIVFTSNLASTRGSWNGIGFRDTSVDAVVDADGNYVSGSTIQYADLSFGGSIATDHSSPYIAHNHIHDGSPTNPALVGAARAMVMFDHPSTGYIVDNIIEGNVGGEVTIAIHKGNGYIDRNIIRNNSGNDWVGAWCSEHSCQIINNVIINNSGRLSGGLFFESGDHVVRHNLIANNVTRGAGKCFDCLGSRTLGHSKHGNRKHRPVCRIPLGRFRSRHYSSKQYLWQSRRLRCP